MAADFWAGYVSGAVGIVVGNPLDLLKTRIQAGPSASASTSQGAAAHGNLAHAGHIERWSALVRGAAAPILGYGALNALLFVTYNRSLALLNTGGVDTWPDRPSALSIWTAGTLGGLATFFVSAPTELVKCRAQVADPPVSSWQVTKDVWRSSGIRGLYMGGGITSVRDSVGYGFYFLTYEFTKRSLSSPQDDHRTEALKTLLCGGLAGVATWVSIFPLDVVKTRFQTYDLVQSRRVTETQPLLTADRSAGTATRAEERITRPSTYQVAREAYRSGGARVFFRGIGVCSARAFIVNAVQWAVYEWTMKLLTRDPNAPQAMANAPGV